MSAITKELVMGSLAQLKFAAALHKEHEQALMKSNLSVEIKKVAVWNNWMVHELQGTTQVTLIANCLGKKCPVFDTVKGNDFIKLAENLIYGNN